MCMCVLVVKQRVRERNAISISLFDTCPYFPPNKIHPPCSILVAYFLLQGPPLSTRGQRATVAAELRAP